MLFEVVMAGFGGQGILFMGDVFAQGALREGRNATFLPTYGVAMRGGTANCVVTVSDEEIGSPLMDRPHAGILMNDASLVKFQPVIRPGGLLVVNASIAHRKSFNRQDDARSVWIPATEISRDVTGSERSANIVALGAFLKADSTVAYETMVTIFSEGAKGKKEMVAKNLAALQSGWDFAG